jgi:hypothetical protein
MQMNLGASRIVYISCSNHAIGNMFELSGWLERAMDLHEWSIFAFMIMIAASAAGQ